VADFADYVLSLVRAQLKRHPAFAHVTRGNLDIYLGDLERDIRCDLERWADAIERMAYEDARADLELEAEMEAAAKRAKPRRTQKQEKHHADH
jgi:hypothetical protein